MKHRVWIKDPTWRPIGEPRPEREAVKECGVYRDQGFQAKALPEGKRPAAETEWSNVT